MRPDDILHARIDLLGKVQSGGLFPEIIRGILEQNVDSTNGGVTPPGTVGLLFRAFHAHLTGAYSYRVTEPMTDLIVAAADGLDESDRFDRDLAPTGAGMVRFDKPLPMVDVRGRTMLVHWLVWGPLSVGTQPAIGMWVFNDIYTQADTYSMENLDDYADLTDIVGRWAFIGATITPNGATLGPARMKLNEHTLRVVTENGDTPTEPTNVSRYVHALWLLLNQTIVASEDERVSRHARKSMARMKMPGTVTVIRLRRSESTPGHGESQVQWQHSWIVRGHWAWRVCGPDHPNAQPYKDGFGTRVWISPYLKGPEDKPLVVTDKLYDLAR